MQHPIGDHALLADGRTAALVAPDGEVAWLCWPRVDSDPILLSILDAEQGGTFALRPRGSAELVERAYIDSGLALRSVWRQGRGRLIVDEALAIDGRPKLLRMLRSEGAAVLVETRLRPAFAAATVTGELRESGRRALAAGAGLLLAVDAPAPWRLEGEVLVSVFKVVPGYPAGVVLGDARDSAGLGDAPERMVATLRWWRGTMAGVDLGGVERSALSAATGAPEAESLLLQSAAVLTGLRQRGGGLVAAPTTSLPQWPGSGRTWDYRYAWLRDTAVGARALARLGLLDDAHGLGAFCGDVVLAGDAPLVRVDEQPAPPECELAHLGGHGGARPVRLGNAAATQSQHDVAGDVLQLAVDLARAHALPESLRRAVPVLAGRAVAGWERPDHGIWEIRGRPRHYTHSRVKAWAALRAAAALCRSRAVEGDAAAWDAAAASIRARVLATAVEKAGWLRLHEEGGGPDGALSEAVLLGFLNRADPRAAATLDVIAGRLGSRGLVDRHAPVDDVLDEPCGPFVFATLWLAAARRRTGQEFMSHLTAALGTGSRLRLFGEVAGPDGCTPLGNYPQVQSHAALVLCGLGPDRA